MRRFDVVFEGNVKGVDAEGRAYPIPADDLEAHLSDVMESLIDLDPASDPAIGGDFVAGSVNVNVSVSAYRPEEAVIVGSGLLRTAIHAAGGFTPDWSVDWLSVNARSAEASSPADADHADDLVDA